MTIRRIYGTGVDEGVPIVVGTAAKPKREDVGERLLELRRTAFQKYYPDALWYVVSVKKPDNPLNFIPELAFLACEDSRGSA